MAGEVSKGQEVWCPNGDGNRFLEREDVALWPMPCPQCGDDFVTERPALYATVSADPVLPDSEGDLGWTFIPAGGD